MNAPKNGAGIANAIANQYNTLLRCSAKHYPIRAKQGFLMSVVDLLDQLEIAARQALLATKALKPCPIHSYVQVRSGDEDAERQAYALATLILKRQGDMEIREELVSAIQDELTMAADEGCPRCASLMDS